MNRIEFGLLGPISPCAEEEEMAADSLQRFGAHDFVPVLPVSHNEGFLNENH